MWLKSRFLRTRRGEECPPGDSVGLAKDILQGTGAPFLLVVSPEPGAELHQGCDGVAPSGWQGHVGLQHLFQQC